MGSFDVHYTTMSRICLRVYLKDHAWLVGYNLSTNSDELMPENISNYNSDELAREHYFEITPRLVWLRYPFSRDQREIEIQIIQIERDRDHYPFNSDQ